MTAVEYILNLVVGTDEQGKDVRVKDTISKPEIAKAKYIDMEQRQSEYTRGFDDGCQRKQQELDHLRGKNHSCQDNFKNPFKNEPKEQ